MVNRFIIWAVALLVWIGLVLFPRSRTVSPKWPPDTVYGWPYKFGVRQSDVDGGTPFLNISGGWNPAHLVYDMVLWGMVVFGIAFIVHQCLPRIRERSGGHGFPVVPAKSDGEGKT
jgi:hypothetical protein